MTTNQLSLQETERVQIAPVIRECVRNLDLRVQVHPGELWVSKSAGAHKGGLRSERAKENLHCQV